MGQNAVVVHESLESSELVRSRTVARGQHQPGIKGSTFDAVIQEAADWIESQQATLQESNDFNTQVILQKAA